MTAEGAGLEPDPLVNEFSGVSRAKPPDFLTLLPANLGTWSRDRKCVPKLARTARVSCAFECESAAWDRGGEQSVLGAAGGWDQLGVQQVGEQFDAVDQAWAGGGEGSVGVDGVDAGGAEGVDLLPVLHRLG